jgi:hypothetical protein
MDTNDDAGDTVVEIARAPAYGLLECGPIQPQCSGDANEFCFFCAFEPQVDEVSGNEHPDSLRSFVRALIAQKRETTLIIRKVFAAYRDNVQPDVQWTNPSGTKITAPAWTLASIKTHLLHSPEFPEIFEDTVEKVFNNIIIAQNKIMMNDNGTPDQATVDSFLSTVGALSRYKESRARLTRLAGARAGKNNR